MTNALVKPFSKLFHGGAGKSKKSATSKSGGIVSSPTGFVGGDHTSSSKKGSSSAHSSVLPPLQQPSTATTADADLTGDDRAIGVGHDETPPPSALDTTGRTAPTDSLISKQSPSTDEYDEKKRGAAKVLLTPTTTNAKIDPTTIQPTTSNEKRTHFAPKPILLVKPSTSNEEEAKRNESYRPSSSSSSSSSSSDDDDYATEEASYGQISRFNSKSKKLHVRQRHDSTLNWTTLEKQTLVGAGTFGQVWLCRRKPLTPTRKSSNSSVNFILPHAQGGAGELYAVKCQAKRDLLSQKQLKAVLREKQILASLGDNPFVCQLYNTFKDETHLYFVLEAYTGGELFSIIHIHKQNRNGLREPSAQFYSANLFDALLYLHSQSILYRDVKPENVMIDAQGFCVLVDFGFARVVASQDKTFTVCGTPLYLAPEVILNRGYNRSADNWSYGCLVYELLVGQNPFYSPKITKIQLFKRIVRGDYAIPDWASLTDTAVHFLESILVVNPYRRLGGGAGGSNELKKTDYDIRTHPWLLEFPPHLMVSKQLTPPWIPPNEKIEQNFENWDHVKKKLEKRPADELKLNKKEQALFDGF